ncbi:MAG: prepilin-type N-terminal cleavage/methylation domain-containing protein [Proteobacteria bacterium]|nr:prepilin-type N-terminal cleavage/methylation domain-containing protein [Pseudomonadota bacterium]
MRFPANEKGFTLIEAMVAMVVLAIGILGVVIMQTRAVSANASAFSRTSGTGVGISVLETLQQMPFNDPNLQQTHAAANLLPNTAAAAMADAQVRRLNAVTLATMSPMLTNVYRVSGPVANPVLTTIGAGASAGSHTYQVAWAVFDNALPGGEVPSKIIRVYQVWTAAMGGGTSIMTTVKYNNIAL